MADETTLAIYAVMAGDSVLAGLLPDFEGGENIHTGRIVPPNAPRPYIWSYGDITNNPFDTKTEPGREVTRDITIAADNSGSEIPVMTIANRVRDLFHRKTLTIGLSNLLTDASGPRVSPSDDSITARIVTVRFIYEL